MWGAPRVRRATAAVRVTAAVAVMSLAAACGTGSVAPESGSSAPPSSSEAPPDAPTPTPTPTTSPGTQAVLDPTYAVAPPGPRTKAVVSADILIQDTEPLSDELVGAVRGLAGVQVAIRISVAQVLLENKLYTIAAVDPAQYRSYTGRDSAEFQEQWDRVAAGEVAVDDRLRRKIPATDDYLALGIDDTTTDVHVGAYAPQVAGIDLVVNTKVGEALGMTMGNALVVSTGEASPQSLRTPIGAILGRSISLQNLDVVTRLGLDPKAFQTAVLVGSFSDAVGVFNYTPIGGGRIAPDPAWTASHISTEVVPILGSVTCNKAIMPQLKAALAEVIDLGLEDKINPGQYAGCYYPRFIAGSTTLSNHSFGLALDLNTPGNQRGTVGEMDRGVVAVFKRWGFAWGGDWRYTDPMHFELSQIVRPG